MIDAKIYTNPGSRIKPIERSLFEFVSILDKYDLVEVKGVYYEAKIVKQMVVDVLAKLFQVSQSLNI